MTTASSGRLPDDSLERLSTLAGVALGVSAGESNRSRVRVEIVQLASSLANGTLTCADATAPGAGPAPASLPDGARAWALVTLSNMIVPIGTEDQPDGQGIALCISIGQVRQWSAADLQAIAALAQTVEAELGLRADLGRQLRLGENVHPVPLHDPDTELANRDLFIDRLEMARLRTARFPDRRFAVLSLSLEQLGTIEMTLGYEAARGVQREFAQRLKSVVRNYDSIGHIASDQFGMLLESIRDDSDPARVANRVHESLRPRIVTRWGELSVSANIGIVLSHAGVDSAGRLMQLAGLARLRARGSAAQYEIYDPQMQEHAETRLHKEMELRRAIEENQFDLHYQPIVSLASGGIVQTEALIRWRHPQRGLVSAADFIGLAEDTGLAVPMGWFTLDRACRQLSSWRTQSPANQALSMSINLTAAHFRQRNVAEQVREIMAKSGVTSGMNFEVTERLLIGDPAKASAILSALRELGVGIHLDDFGTGYSSLQYLHDLPFDAIKIDRSFIGRMANGGRDAQIVTTIRELARQLGVPVIAEGVETAEHLSLVRDLGCEFAQGYFFARPMPADDVAGLLSTNPRW